MIGLFQHLFGCISEALADATHQNLEGLQQWRMSYDRLKVEKLSTPRLPYLD